jgi:hypothetical protein
LFGVWRSSVTSELNAGCAWSTEDIAVVTFGDLIRCGQDQQATPGHQLTLQAIAWWVATPGSCVCQQATWQVAAAVIATWLTISD